jgi:hypothetical protein
MTECLTALPRYLHKRSDGWYGTDHADGPWRPIPAPQAGLPWQAGEPAPEGKAPAAISTSNCFHLGDIWRSPRGKYWQVDRIANHQVRLRALHSRHSTQWRFAWNTGLPAMTNAWERIESAADPITYPD